jgi:hypothetical protein
MTSLEYSSLKTMLASDSKTFLVKTKLELFLEKKNYLKDSNWKMKAFVKE